MVIFLELVPNSGTVVLGEANKLVFPCDFVFKDWSVPEVKRVTDGGDWPDPELDWLVVPEEWHDRWLFWLVEAGFISFDAVSGDEAISPDFITCSPLEYLEPDEHKNRKTINLYPPIQWTPLQNYNNYFHSYIKL